MLTEAQVYTIRHSHTKIRDTAIEYGISEEYVRQIRARTVRKGGKRGNPKQVKFGGRIDGRPGIYTEFGYFLTPGYKKIKDGDTYREIPCHRPLTWKEALKGRKFNIRVTA